MSPGRSWYTGFILWAIVDSGDKGDGRGVDFKTSSWKNVRCVSK